MIKNFSQLNIKVDDKDFYFYCEINATFQTVKEALFQLQKYVGAIEDQLRSQQEQAEAEKKAAEENKPSEEVA